LIHAAIDKASTSEEARRNLHWLDGDGQLDENVRPRAMMALMGGAHPGLARELGELEGEMRFNGERDPLTSSIGVAKYAVEKMREHIRADIEPTPADVLGDADVSISGGVVVLSREQAKDARVFKAAQSVANDRGLDLRVEQTSVPTITPSTNNGSGGAV
jgi:hypothetical protein